MRDLPDATGSFVIDSKHLTSDMAHTLVKMINDELHSPYSLYTTEVEDYDFTHIEETYDQCCSSMSANFNGVGKSSYLTNLKHFFEWAAIENHADEFSRVTEHIKEKYYPLLSMMAKHQIKIIFTYYEHEKIENIINYNIIAVSLNKHAFLNRNKIQTEITILEENERRATYSELEEHYFINPNDFSTKEQLDRGECRYYFNNSTEYKIWLDEMAEKGYLSDDRSKFINHDNEECTINIQENHLIPII